MQIDQFLRRREACERRLEIINREISERWERLMGFGRGYLKTFKDAGDYIYFTYSDRHDHYGEDRIHKHFFKFESCYEAEVEFKKAKKTDLPKANWGHSYKTIQYDPA